MKELEGYVCVGRYAGIDVLYGKSTTLENQTFQSLNSNGFLPFESSEEAEHAKKEISEKMKSLFEVKTGGIKLSIIENPQERRFIEGKEEFIVLMRRYGQDWLMIGVSQKGQENLYPLLGADLRRNGLKPFTNIEEAIEVAREVARQAETYSTVAHFQLEELS